MDAVSGDKLWLYETTGALHAPVCVRMSSPADQSGIHNQETRLPGLLRLRRRIRLFVGIDASGTAWRCRKAPRARENRRTGQSLHDLSPILEQASRS